MESAKDRLGADSEDFQNINELNKSLNKIKDMIKARRDTLIEEEELEKSKNDLDSD